MRIARNFNDLSTYYLILYQRFTACKKRYNLNFNTLVVKTFSDNRDKGDRV